SQVLTETTVSATACPSAAALRRVTWPTVPGIPERASIPAHPDSTDRLTRASHSSSAPAEIPTAPQKTRSSTSHPDSSTTTPVIGFRIPLLAMCPLHSAAARKARAAALRGRLHLRPGTPSLLVLLEALCDEDAEGDRSRCEH